MSREQGFSLLELAIALVIIGFLIGAVIQGQKLVYNARIQRIASDMRDCAKAFVLYYDRHGMYPGDEDDPAFPSGDALEGNHNGLIDPAEAGNVWDDLTNSIGVLRRSSPVRGGTYAFGLRNFFGAANQNYISVSNMPNQMAESIDARHDDGVFNTGNIHSSAAYNGSETLVTVYWRI